MKPLSTSELAHAGGVSIGTVRRLERLGLLRAVRDYRGWRAFSPTEIERLRELMGWKVFETAPPDGDGIEAARDRVASRIPDRDREPLDV
jgi:hypothetical protein